MLMVKTKAAIFDFLHQRKAEERKKFVLKGQATVKWKERGGVEKYKNYAG